MPQYARASPATPPDTASTALSTIDRRSSTHRLAPNAERTAKSFAARAERASSRFTMFAQAMSSTSTTAPKSTHSVRPMSPTTCSCAGTSVTPQPAIESGFSPATSAAMPVNSACALSGVAPGASRPIALYMRCGLV